MNSSKPSSPLAPWDSAFAERSRLHVARNVDLYAPGDTSDSVYLVESGAIVEIRTDATGVSHAVGLSGPGSLLGARLTTGHQLTHSVRATALIDSVVREMKRDDFLHATLLNPDLSTAYMREMSKRLEAARILTDTCSASTTGDHILGVLHAIATSFGVGRNGSSSVSVRNDLLEQMTGTPHRLFEATIHELGSHGLVQLEKDGVRWVA
ncbi:MAG: Crp/Fnr family transcriptional regulator [Candidatus Kapabacteria bacterium]|nr:Crp/Fnr family transcriptional regulator [Candidatus Kapabacteria bacterium]